MLNYASDVAATSVAVFGLGLVISVGLAVTRAFGNPGPWITFAILCLVRVIGNSFTLALATMPNISNPVGLAIGAAVCSAVGLGPIIVALTVFLRQCREFDPLNPANLSGTRAGQIEENALRILNLVTLAATAVAIAGGVQSWGANSTGAYTFQPSVTFKVSAVLYLVVLVCLIVLTFVAVRGLSRAASTTPMTNNVTGRRGDWDKLRLLIPGLFVILVFLVVRIIYYMLLTFDTDPAFNLLTGSETIRLCLAYIEEWVILCIFLGMGVLVKDLRPVGRGNRLDINEANEAAPEKGQYGLSEHGSAPRRKPVQWWRYVPIVRLFVS